MIQCLNMKLNNSPKYKIDAKEGEHNYSIAHNARSVADLIQKEEPFINKPVWRERQQSKLTKMWISPRNVWVLFHPKNQKIK